MKTLAGTGTLVRLILRRDRFILPLWIVLLAVIPMTYVASLEELYPTAADRAGYAATSGTNPTFLALYGPVYSTTVGGLVSQRAGFMPIIVALISLLMVIRHTRTEEEAGRRELLGSTVVGRHANVVAALIATWAANVVLAVLLAVFMMSQGLPTDGSVALGLEFAMAGCVFAAVGAVTAQLSEGAGAARAIAILVLGSSFVLRLASDVGGEGSGAHWLAWLSPIGWGRRLEAYADEQWWVLGLGALLVAVLATAAILLSAHRDVGQGVLPARLGPAFAAPGLKSPLALAWRLHRGLLIGWTAGFIALGLVFGSIVDGAEDLINDNEAMRQVFERLGGASALIDAFLAGILGIMGLIASGYAVQATLRLRTEETALRAEPVLAAAVSRPSWVASHLTFGFLGPTVAMLVGGLVTGLVYGLISGDVGKQVPSVLAGAAVQLPAVWILTGITVALFGLLPRLTPVAWGVLALFLFLGQVGGILQLNQLLLDISPFTHIPKIPGGDLTVLPLAVLVGITALLTVAGFAGFRRRDVG